jgi:hypothetical protein
VLTPGHLYEDLLQIRLIEMLVLCDGSGEFTPPRLGYGLEQTRQALATAQQGDCCEGRVPRCR